MVHNSSCQASGPFYVGVDCSLANVLPSYPLANGRRSMAKTGAERVEAHRQRRKAEIEHLRAEIEHLRAEIEHLRAKNGQLRAALGLVKALEHRVCETCRTKAIWEKLEARAKQ